MKENNSFFCYSIKLKDFLKLQGLRYADTGMHHNGNLYWRFTKSEELDNALRKWNKYKEVFGKEN